MGISKRGGGDTAIVGVASWLVTGTAAIGTVCGREKRRYILAPRIPIIAARMIFVTIVTFRIVP